MRGLWLEDEVLSFRDDLPEPRPAPGEALVKVALAGVCGTDLELLRGYYPFRGIPGHEFVGRVAKAPEPGWEGRRVVGEINVGCGGCADCRTGNRSHCRARTAVGIRGRDGVFAEYAALPLSNLWEVPDAVTDQEAVFVEPLAAALRIQEQVPIFPSSQVLVVGAGRLGQLAARTLALTGCRLQVLVKHDRQRKALMDLSGNAVVESDLGPGLFDVVVEASGSPDGFRVARRAVRPRGTIVLKSTYQGWAQIDLSSLAVDEVTLVGSRCGNFPSALRLLESRWVDVLSLVDEIFELGRGLEAFEKAAGGAKALLRC